MIEALPDLTPAGPRVPILDHGYLQEIESWGSDERIVEAARMSVGKGFLGWEPGQCPLCLATGSLGRGNKCHGCDGTGKIRGDKFLLKYLWENHHATPFEMGGITIEIQAPIETFRQWQRSRTQSYNEMSARYVPLPDFNYLPTAERLLVNSTTNKQAGTAKGAAQLTEAAAHVFRQRLAKIYQDAETLYQWALSEGVPKELARLHIPVGRYSRMRASANLRNWLGFMTLRSDVVPSGKHAQWEIRQFANAVADVVKKRFPRTYDLFVGEFK